MEEKALKAIAQSKIRCAFLPIPFSNKSRKLYEDAPTGDESLVDYCQRLGIKLVCGNRYTIRINGTAIPYKWWSKVYPKPNCYITVTATANAVAVPFIIAALATAAPTIAAAGLTAAGLSATAFAVAAVATAITVGGALLLGAIFKPSVATANSSLGQRAGTEGIESPTYSISGGSNAIRRFQPLPIVLGSHLMFFDSGSIPYTQFEGDSQYLYQIYEVGVADCNITDIQIGTTLITEFEEVETEIAPFSTGTLSLFPANTLSTLGAALEPEEVTFTTRTSASDAVALRVELEGSITTIEQNTGKTKSDVMILVIEFRLGSSGPFSKLIDSTNTPQGITLDNDGNVVITSASKRKIRKSLYRTVAEGQYEVRIRRVPRKTDSSSFSTRSMAWTQLLSHQKDSANYENRKRLAVRIRSSGQVNGAIDRLNGIVSTLIPVWNGSSEDILESSNPGHLFIFLARGASNSDNRRRFGGLLVDSKIDLDGLRTWATWCDTNDLKCDLIIDSAMPTYDVLSMIARCGRATPAWNSGKLGVVYDEEGRQPVQIFGMFNIKKNTFSVNYITENLANEIVVSYIDQDRDYQRNQVRVQVPGETAKDRPANIEIAGVVRLSQASEEANLIAATQFYRRKQINFDTDIENLVALRGDVITMAHDLTAWALSGRLITGTATILVLDREVTVTAASFITIRKPDLDLTTHSITTSPGLTDTITISPALALAPDDDTDNKVKDYVWFFEDSSTPGKDFKIINIETNSDFSVTISAVEEVAAYYTSASGDFEFIDNDLYNGQVASVSDIAFSETLLDNSGVTQVTISWISIQTISVDVEISINGETPTVTNIIDSNSIDIVTIGGAVLVVKIRVNAIVLLRSSETVQTATYTVAGLNQLPSDIASFLVARNGDTATFRWSAISDIDLDFYELRKGDSWDTSILIEKTKSLSHQVLDVTAGSYLIKAVDFGGRQSQSAAVVAIGSTVGINAVLQDNEQDSNWPGTFDDTVVNQDNQLTLAGDSTWADLTDPWDTYTSSWQTTVSFKLTGTYITDVFDLGALNDESTRVDVEMIVSLIVANYTWASLSLPWTEYHTGWTWAGPEGRIVVGIEIQTSDDDITYTAFAEFVPGAFNARYYKFRITLTAIDSNVLPAIDEFNVTYDVPDRVETFEDQTIASGGGTTITYARPFLTVPNVVVTLQSASEGDTYLASSKTINDVNIQVFDDAGVDIGGNVDVHVRGY